MLATEALDGHVQEFPALRRGHALKRDLSRLVEKELNGGIRLFGFVQLDVVRVCNLHCAKIGELEIGLDQCIPHVKGDDLLFAEVCNCWGHGCYSVSTDIANQYRFSEEIILYLLTKKNPGNR
ncbi:hypothetical protein D3C85_1262380 [compost metagenome]